MNQTYPYLEVIVVDDGSSDNSHEIIASYRNQVVPLLKENGGQASTFNAGVEVSQGEIVIFLDADDVLLPDTVQRVVDAFRMNPGISKVQYALALIDESGKLIGRVMPPRPLSSGDLRMHVLKYYSYGWPPTSGNAFPSHVLHRLLPIPEKEYRISADMYLADLSVLLGPVVSLNKIGGYYRAHGKNYYSLIHNAPGGQEDISRLRGFIHRIEIGHSYQQRLAQELGIIKKPQKLFQTWDLLSSKMTSLKLDPANHPGKEETLIRLAARGALAAIKEPGYFPYQRLVHAIWFITMLLFPKKYAISMAEKLYHPEKRGRMGQLLAKLKKRQIL